MFGMQAYPFAKRKKAKIENEHDLRTKDPHRRDHR